MPWTYKQTTGELFDPSDKLFVSGWAGQNIITPSSKIMGLNNPLCQDIHNIGPLPVGRYLMAEYFSNHPVTGMCAIRLDPSIENNMFGRSGFFIHGQSLMNPLHSSEGCIVVGSCSTRMEIWKSSDKILIVIN